MVDAIIWMLVGAVAGSLGAWFYQDNLWFVGGLAGVVISGLIVTSAKGW